MPFGNQKFPFSVVFGEQSLLTSLVLLIIYNQTQVEAKKKVKSVHK